MKSIPHAILPLLLALFCGTAVADRGVLLLDTIARAPANAPGGLPRPIHGQAMDPVRQRFGEPGERLSPVGDPPITRWVYGAYTVYFERDRVISTVVHRQQ